MDQSWIVEQQGWRREEIEFLGSKFTIGNGYFGYRGTLEEYSREQLTACTLSELYDDSGSGWREILNVHNPLWIRGQWGGVPLSVLETQPKSHRQWLALDQGLDGRETVFQGPGCITLSCQRFASVSNIHLLCARYALTAEQDAAVTVSVGIDRDLWELKGPHYQEAVFAHRDGCLCMDGLTGEMAYRVSVAQAVLTEGGWMEEHISENQRTFHLRLQAGVPASLTICAAICKSTDCPDPAKDAPRLAQAAVQAGWSSLLAAHRQVWRNRWETFDVVIGGDADAQLALRHSIFLLTCAAPFHTGGIAIPARGLSGQVYKGGMFWDTELYFLPMFLHCAPQTARNLVSYRIRNLSGALAKAKEEGYSGAFYPWESQETGQEGCTYYNLTDIFTGRSAPISGTNRSTSAPLWPTVF